VLPFLGLLLASCGRYEGQAPPDAQVQTLQLKEELERSRKKLALLERGATSKDDNVALAKEEAEKAAKDSGDKDRLLAEKDARIAALEKDVADLKKGEPFAYVESSKLHQEGMNASALLRYRQFIKTYPKSPLVADANRAINELAPIAPGQPGAHAATPDPRIAEREFQRQFSDGFASVQDIGVMLKHRFKADVIRLLGTPNTTYRDGLELGYVDKVIDPATGGRGTLVIAFEDGQVSTLRVGYQGRPIRP
jgi:hypothetical protein